jgi:hypothetical protein
MSGAVAQQFTPEQRTASQGRAGQAAGVIRESTRGAVEGANAKKAQLVKLAMTQGPAGQAAQAALLKMAGVTPGLQGAQRYMNLGGGKVMDMVTKEAIDYSDSPMDDPSKRYKVVDGQLVDIGHESGKPTVVIEKYDAGKTSLQNIGVAGNMMQTHAITMKGGKVESMEALGEPWDRKQFIETSSGDPIKESKPYRVRMELDKEVLKNARVRLTSIGKKFKPLYQTYLGKIGAGAGDFASKIGLLKATPEKFQEYVTKFKAFQQDVNANVNLYIKEITGAQMSEAEAGRLMKAMANLQDSPQAFESKFNNSAAQLDAAIKRKEKIITDLLGEDKDMDYDKANEIAKNVLASEPIQPFDSLIAELESGVSEQKTGGLAKGEDGVWRLEE